MNVKLTKGAAQALILSLLIVAAGLAAWLSGGAARFHASDASMIDFAQMWLCLAAAVIFSFAFGLLRYSLAAGAALATGVAHDALVTWALTGVTAIALPQSASFPVALLMTVACTYCQTLPRLRAARQIYRSTSLREITLEEVAVKAAESHGFTLIAAPAVALAVVIAAAVSGNVRLLTSVLPLAIALAVSAFSARAISPYVWAAVAALRRPARRRA